MIHLEPIDLAGAAALVLVLGLLSWRLRLGLEGRLLVAGLRGSAQLGLIGLVLKQVFAHATPAIIAGIAILMTLLAGREVLARQSRPLAGPWGFATGAASVFVSSFAVALFALAVVIGPDPWYAPAYAIPLLGMLLGNTMTGISIALDHLTRGVEASRPIIEARLALGETSSEATAGLRRSCVRTGTIPIINSMAAAGAVSLPGTFTGQILAGAAPLDAAAYQILILFLIAAGTGFGVVTAVEVGGRRLFDDRHRLRLDRLRPARSAGR